MNSPEGVLAVGSLLLTIMGGFAANMLSVFLNRRRENRMQNINGYHIVFAVLMVIFLLIAIAPFFYYLVFTNFWQNLTIFLVSIGVILSVLSSLFINLFCASYDRHIDSKIQDNRWLNSDGISMLYYGFWPVLALIYLLLLFSQMS